MWPRILCQGKVESYRLHQHVVFAEEQSHPAVLVQRFHVLAGRRGGGRALVYAAAGVSLLDLQDAPTQINLANQINNQADLHDVSQPRSQIGT